MKLYSVTGYCWIFTVVRVLFSLVLSTVTYEVSLWKVIKVQWKVQVKSKVQLRTLMFFGKVWINMKSCYDFMFFITVCYSFIGFKCVLQKFKDQKKKWLEICQTLKNYRNFERNRIWSNFKCTKKGQASLSKFWHMSFMGCRYRQKSNMENAFWNHREQDFEKYTDILQN